MCSGHSRVLPGGTSEIVSARLCCVSTRHRWRHKAEIPAHIWLKAHALVEQPQKLSANITARSKYTQEDAGNRSTGILYLIHGAKGCERCCRLGRVALLCGAQRLHGGALFATRLFQHRHLGLSTHIM